MTQLSESGARGSPPRGWPENELGSVQDAAILSEIFARRSDSAPPAGPVGSRGYPLARTKAKHLACLHGDPAPDWHSPVTDRQRDKDHVRRRRNKGDPRQLLVTGG